jgi:hypothetical protein
MIGPRIRELLAEAQGSKAIAAALTAEGYRTHPWQAVESRPGPARSRPAGPGRMSGVRAGPGDAVKKPVPVAAILDVDFFNSTVTDFS